MARLRKTAVQRYHDRVAGRYDQVYDDAYWQWHDALTWDHLKAHLPAETARPVLDLGCGTGKWAIKLAKSGYRPTCVDLSAAMLERARRRFAGTGLEDRVRFVQADLVDLSSLPRAEYSLAVALGEPIGCAAHPAKALKEIRRRLIDGGVLVASFDNRWAAIDYYLDRGQSEELAEFLTTGLTHWLTRETAERFPIHTYSPGQLTRLLDQAGYDLIDMIGKTVLPMRHHRGRLAEPVERRRWMKIEKRLWRDPAAIGRAAHLQVAARTRVR